MVNDNMEATAACIGLLEIVFVEAELSLQVGFNRVAGGCLVGNLIGQFWRTCLFYRATVPPNLRFEASFFGGNVGFFCVSPPVSDEYSPRCHETRQPQSGPAMLAVKMVLGYPWHQPRPG